MRDHDNGKSDEGRHAAGDAAPPGSGDVIQPTGVSVLTSTSTHDAR